MLEIKKILIAILLAIMFITTNSSAQPAGYPCPARGKEPPIKMFADELKLTDAQTKAIEEVRYKKQMEAIDMKAQLEKEELQLKKSMDDPTFDRKKIQAQAEKVVKLEGDLKLLKIKGQLDMLEVLTQDQRVQLKQIKKEKHPKLDEAGEGQYIVPGGHKCPHMKQEPPPGE